MPESSGQRRYPRFAIKLPVLYKVVEPAAGKPGIGWSRDLSEGGGCLEVANPLPPSSILWVLLRSDQGGLELPAKVVWTGDQASGKGGIPHGVAFSAISPEQRTALRELILQHKVQLRLAGVRVPMEIPVRWRPKGGGGRLMEGRTGDISRGGLMLLLPVVIPPPALLEVTLPTHRGEVEAVGEVVWVEPLEKRAPGEPVRHGLRFVDLSWPHQLTLGLLLAEAP